MSSFVVCVAVILDANSRIFFVACVLCAVFQIHHFYTFIPLILAIIFLLFVFFSQNDTEHEHDMEEEFRAI